MTDRNMKFFSLQQALNDVINFISHIKAVYKIPHNHNTKWIVYGCGAGGTIATLLRAQRPDLVDGVVAFSAPLKFKIDFPEYFKIGELAYERYSPSCIDDIAEGFKQIESLTTQSDGLETLRSKLNLCDLSKSVLSKKDVDFLAWSITLELSERAINENIYNTDVNLNRLVSYETLCDAMTNDTRPKLDVFAENINKMLLEDDIDCIHLYDDYLERARNSSYFKDELRQSRYLYCYVGFIPTSELVANITGDGFNLDSHLSICEDIFPSWNRSELEKYVRDENKYLESVLPRLTNAVFTTGTNDLWRSTTYNTTNPKSRSLVVEGASHCAVWYKSHPEDTPEIRDARKEITEIVENWIIE